MEWPVAESLSVADRERFIAYLERGATACDVAVKNFQADNKHDHWEAVTRLRNDAAAFRRVAEILRETEAFEG